MATRIEKIYKKESLELISYVLKEVLKIVSNNAAEPTSDTKISIANSCKNIAEKVCKFLEMNNISANEVRKA